MATTLEKWQEISNRGLQDNLAPDKRARFDEALRRGLITESASFAENAVGAAESAGAIISGAISEPVAGLAGLAASAIPGLNEGAGAAAVESVSDAMTYEPRTKAGRAQIMDIANFIKPMAEGIETVEKTLGDLGYELGDLIPIEGAAEIGGTIGTTIPTAAMELLGLSGAKGALKGASKTSKAGESAAKSAKTSLVKAVDEMETRPLLTGKGKANARVAELIKEGSADAETAGVKLPDAKPVAGTASAATLECTSDP